MKNNTGKPKCDFYPIRIKHSWYAFSGLFEDVVVFLQLSGAMKQNPKIRPARHKETKSAICIGALRPIQTHTNHCVVHTVSWPCTLQWSYNSLNGWLHGKRGSHLGLKEEVIIPLSPPSSVFSLAFFPFALPHFLLHHHLGESLPILCRNSFFLFF